MCGPLKTEGWGSEQVSRTYWNARIFGETLRGQEAAQLLTRVTIEHRSQFARLQEYAAQHLALVHEQLKAFANSGIDLSEYKQVRNTGDLTAQQMTSLLRCPPTLAPVPNGEEHTAGEDKAGVYLISWDVLASAKLQNDATYAGEAIPGGTMLFAALSLIQRAKEDIAAKQKAIFVRIFGSNGKESEASPSRDSSTATQVI